MDDLFKKSLMRIHRPIQFDYRQMLFSLDKSSYNRHWSHVFIRIETDVEIRNVHRGSRYPITNQGRNRLLE